MDGLKLAAHIRKVDDYSAPISLDDLHAAHHNGSNLHRNRDRIRVCLGSRVSMLHYGTLPVCVFALGLPNIVGAVILNGVAVCLTKRGSEEHSSHLLRRSGNFALKTITNLSPAWIGHWKSLY